MKRARVAWHIVTGDPHAESTLATVIQLVLISAWIPQALLAVSRTTDWLYETRRAHIPQLVVISDFWPLGAYELAVYSLIMLAFAAGVGIPAWFVYRFVACRGRPEFRRFVRNWWRTCLWATLFIAIVFAVAASQPSKRLAEMTLLLDVVFLIVAPALLAREEAGRRRRSRWRPVCPECGYSAMHAALPRCPECGTNYPCERKFYRRWAIQRGAWDRADRGVWLIAYARTLLFMALCPCRAARRLANPDRFARAIRWAALHVVAAAVLATLLGSGQYYVHRVIPVVHNIVLVVQNQIGTEVEPAQRVLLWFFESLAVWLALLAALPASGFLLACLVPRMQPTARAAIAKWTLYSTALLVPIVLVALLLNEWKASRVFGRTRLGVPIMMHALRPSLWAIVVFFGVWWAAGVAGNPWLHRRGLRVWLVGAFAFLALWLLLVAVLTPPGALVSLL